MVDRQEAAQIGQLVVESLAESFSLLQYQVFITASVGIALYPDDGTDIDSLLKAAHAAMHQGKQKGGNCYQIYTAAIQEKSYDRLMLESALHQALERNEFLVYYQPQVDVTTGLIVGASALVRWQHPQRGLVSPADFIPVAEENGLIVSIDPWVLETVARQIKTWQQRGFSLKVAVNLSALQFNQPDCSRNILEILQSTGLSSSYLELELTEGAVVQNPESARSTLKTLKNLGLELSLDDFGTGYSCLSYLQQFPFDRLKIDRSFIHKLTENSKNAAITSSIIQLAHGLNLKVIA